MSLERAVRAKVHVHALLVDRAWLVLSIIFAVLDRRAQSL